MSIEPVRAAPSAALTEADQALLRSLGQWEAKAVTMATSYGSQAEFRNRYRESLYTAAFLSDFDPAALMPGIGEADLKRLLRDCTVSTDGMVTRWRLTASVRGELLGKLIRDGATEHYIAAAANYSAGTAQPPDAFAQALVALCRGHTPNRHSLAATGIETWSAYRAALASLKGTGVPDAPRVEAILTEVSYAEMMEPFRFLTGWRPITPPPEHEAGQVYGEDAFVGRQDKLALLRSFVDVLASKSYYESLSRSVKRLWGGASRTLILSGIGGVGKSTLVAKFILDHVSEEPSRIRFAYLDFDRSTINPSQPSTLVLELIRQLRWQIPQVGEQLDGLRDRLRTDIRASAANPDPVTSDRNEDESTDTAPGETRLPLELIPPFSLQDYLNDLSNLVRQADSTEKKTILLVLDTFEEVQTSGNEAVERVQRMVNALSSTTSIWRTLIVGRDAVDGFFNDAARDELKEFDDQTSRRAFLAARGVPAALTAQVAQIAGGRPLALLLAARLVREHGIEAIELSMTQRLGRLFRQRLIEGVLYQRILDHISDERVRQIAHPGLVLRWIDASVIASVIVPVLGLSDFDETKIEQVMAAFRRQKDLVRVEPDDSVVHRSDVRAQMLELLTAEDPDTVMRLHRAAVDYYVKQQRDGSSAERLQRLRIEELYHQLCLGEDLDRVVQRWIPPARSALARAQAEIMSPRGRIALNILLGRLPSIDEVQNLPPLLAEELAVRTVKSGIAYNAPEKALNALERAATKLPKDFAALYRPLTLDRVGQWRAASPGYEELARHTSNRKHLLAAADFFERLPSSQDQGEISKEGILMIRQLWDRLSQLPQRTADIELVMARLQRRAQYGHSPASVELPQSVAHFPVTGVATAKSQWLVTLSSEVEERGLALFDGMPVTNPMRRQLTFLIMQFEGEYKHVEPELREFCHVLWASSNIGLRGDNRQGEFANSRQLWPVLRHIMRPATPQWYVPLAATLRRSLGPVVETGHFFDLRALPRLPEPPPAQITSTRALAELFAQLDQLGILQLFLRHMMNHWSELWNSPFMELSRAYDSWRKDMFPAIDPWLENLVSVH
jgi:hypothetical protein